MARIEHPPRADGDAIVDGFFHINQRHEVATSHEFFHKDWFIRPCDMECKETCQDCNKQSAEGVCSFHLAVPILIVNPARSSRRGFKRDIDPRARFAPVGSKGA